MIDLSNYVRKTTINLTQEEIVELMVNRDEHKETLTKCVLPLVLKMAQSFYVSTRIDINELFSYGLESVYTAIKSYDPTKGVSYGSYVAICVRSGMVLAIKENNLIKQPTNKDKQDKWMVKSADENITEDGLTIYDMTAYDEQPYKEWIDEIEIRERVRDLVNDKAANMFISYFGMGTDRLSSRELEKIYGVSRQRVNQIIHQTLKKIREDENILQLIGRFTD